MLIQAHHVGFLDWPAFQANQERIRSNARAERHQSGGAVREGSALLQGIGSCGHCGRGLFTYYRGHHATPGYRCSGNDIGDGGGPLTPRQTMRRSLSVPEAQPLLPE